LAQCPQVIEKNSTTLIGAFESPMTRGAFIWAIISSSAANAVMLGKTGLDSAIPAPIMLVVKRRREMLLGAVMCLCVMFVFVMVLIVIQGFQGSNL
jgi:hypothetical protein